MFLEWFLVTGRLGQTFRRRFCHLLVPQRIACWPSAWSATGWRCQVAEVDQTATGEIEYIFGLGQEVWAFLAQACGARGGGWVGLRPQSLHATLASLGYFYWRVPDTRQPPWSLCSGDMVLADDEASGSRRPREQLKALRELVGNVPRSPGHRCRAWASMPPRASASGP